MAWLPSRLKNKWPRAGCSSGRRLRGDFRTVRSAHCQTLFCHVGMMRSQTAGRRGVPRVVPLRETSEYADEHPVVALRATANTMQDGTRLNSLDLQKHVAAANELAGRVIAITGASSGIGRAVALACAQYGANVVLIGRNARKLETVHGEIEAAGWPEPIIALLDLEKAIAKDYDQLADALLQKYGRLDGLLHNAGLLGSLSPIEHYDVPTWCRVMHVNVTAAFALTQVLMPALKKSA